ncbi:hypothetical protein LWI29_024047 [Acer saccharum]|uniref:Uncharacterized protein n=1 Tax=Acer saccharum TaxID=4024 RepID=A0AA39SMV3_ACESA|nr:hypothetical protein LWI29_024047 [Acer saccharum]
MIALFLLLELLLKHVIWIFLPVSSETAKHFALPCIKDSCLMVRGKVVFTQVPQNVVVSPASSDSSAFIGATSTTQSSRHVFSLGFLYNLAREEFTLHDEVSSDAAAENTFYILLLPVLEGVKDNSGLVCKGLPKMSSNSALRVGTIHLSFSRILSRILSKLSKKGNLEVSLATLQCEIYTVSPIKEFGQNFLFASIGLLDMYNSGGAVDTMNWIIELSECIIKIKGTGCGRFGAYSNIKPQRKEREKELKQDNFIDGDNREVVDGTGNNCEDFDGSHKTPATRRTDFSQDLRYFHLGFVFKYDIADFLKFISFWLVLI